MWLRRFKPNKAHLRVATLAILIVMCTLVILSAVFPFPEGEWSFLSIGICSQGPRVAAQGIGNWIINGTTVYIDDENAYLSATPHTLNGSGWVEFSAISKNWSGYIDVVWGLEAGLNISVSKPQRWALNVSHEVEEWEIVERQYEWLFNGIVGWDNIGWGSGEEPDIGNYNNTHLVKLEIEDPFGNSTVFRNIAFNSHVQHSETSATFYGNYDNWELVVHYEYYDDWMSWNPPSPQSVDYTYAGVDKWHIVEMDKYMNAGQEYRVRCWVDVPFTGLTQWNTKYVWAVKPQAQTIQEAIASGHLYLLDPWLSGGWDQRVKITIDHNDIDDSQTHFPVTLFLGTAVGNTSSDDVSFIFDELQSDDNRLKIAVTEDDEVSQLYVGIEDWDDASETAVLHVSKTGWTVSNTSDTEIYLYYDKDVGNNTAYVGDAGDAVAENVWNSNFKMVQHMNSASDAQLVDSTGNDNDSTANTLDSTTGNIDGAMDGDGSEHATVGDFDDSGSTLSVFAWANAAAQDLKMIASHVDTNQWAWRLASGQAAFSVTDKLLVQVLELDASAYKQYESSVTAFDSTWHYVGFTFSSGTLKLYVDGVEDTSVTKRADGAVTSIPNSSADIMIAADSPSSPANIFTGDIDEVSIATTEWTAAWIKASYETKRDHFVDWGSEESINPEITNTPGSNNFGILEVNTTSSTVINYFQIENTGNCVVDVVIYGTDATGGDDTWTLSDTATPGENIYGLYAGLDDADDNYDVIVRKTETYNTLVSDLAEDATQNWGLKIYMPTSLSGYDAQEMSATITLVASEAT